MIDLSDPNSPLSVIRSDSAPTPRSGWRHARTTSRWLATTALLCWLAMCTDWHAAWVAVASASIPWLIAATGMYLASQFASVARWEILVRAVGLTQPRRHLLAAYFEGEFVNVSLPTTLGGDMVKVLRVGGASNKRIAASTVVADRVSGLGALLTLLAIGLFLKLDDSRGIAVPLCVAAILVALLFVIFSSRSRTKPWDAAGRQRYSIRIPVLRRVSRFLPTAIRQLATQAPWLRVLAWAFLVQGLNVAALAAAARAIGLSIQLVEIVIAATTVSLAVALPISVGGIGVREISLPLLLAADGVPRDTAVALGILWSAIVLSVGLLGGPIHFVEQRRALYALEPRIPADSTAPRRVA